MPDEQTVMALLDLPGFIKAEHDGEEWFVLFQCGDMEIGADGDWKRTWVKVAHPGYAENATRTGDYLTYAVELMFSTRNDACNIKRGPSGDQAVADRVIAMIKPWLLPGADLDAVIARFKSDVPTNDPALLASKEAAAYAEKLRRVLKPLFLRMVDSAYAGDSKEMSMHAKLVKEMREVGYTVDACESFFRDATYDKDGLHVWTRPVDDSSEATEKEVKKRSRTEFAGGAMDVFVAPSGHAPDAYALKVRFSSNRLEVRDCKGDADDVMADEALSILNRIPM